MLPSVRRGTKLEEMPCARRGRYNSLRCAISFIWLVTDASLSDELAIQSGLDTDSPGFARRLWAATHQSYSLEQRIAELKFGPH